MRKLSVSSLIEAATIFIWLGLIPNNAVADSTQVHFFEGPWKQVLAQAKALDKPIFVDLFTTWCAPCKIMEKEAFSNLQVAKLFNDKFISYRVDAEKGEGKFLKHQFTVLAYPTLLFIDSDGKVIYRTAGYGGVEHLLAEATKVINVSENLRIFTDPTTLSGNKQNSASSKAYLQELAKLRQPVGSLLEDYLKHLPQNQLNTPENLAIMAGTVATTNSTAFDVLLTKLPIIKDSAIGREALITMPMAIASDFKMIVSTNDEKALNRLIDKYRQFVKQGGSLSSELIEQELLTTKIDFYRQTKSYKTYHQLASFYAETQLMSQSIDSLREQDQVFYKRFERGVVASDSLKKTAHFSRLNESMKHRASGAVADRLDALAKAYYETMTDPIYLDAALRWSRQALLLNAVPFYQDTYACLLYKKGQRREAITQQEQAVASSKERGEPSEALETTLTKMKSGIL